MVLWDHRADIRSLEHDTDLAKQWACQQRDKIMLSCEAISRELQEMRFTVAELPAPQLYPFSLKSHRFRHSLSIKVVKAKSIFQGWPLSIG